MKILRLHVENFGTLQNFDLTPDAGLTVLHRENGWGKSTLMAFIKAMLYGLPASRNRSLDENERKKYTPWQGGVFGGSMEFETSKGKFRAERVFAAKEAGDSFSLFDLQTNLPSAIYSQNLGEELFGIDDESFERSLFLSQFRKSAQRKNEGILARLGNLLDAADDVDSFGQAMELLSKTRKQYVRTGNRGQIAEKKQERTEAMNALSVCRADAEILEGYERDRRAIEATIRTLEKEETDLQRRRADVSRQKETRGWFEQKNQYLAKLADLDRERKFLEDFFGGTRPDDGEIRDARAALDLRKAAQTKLSDLPAVNPNAEALEALRLEFGKGIPDPALFDSLNRENDDLLYACNQRRTKIEYLQSGSDNGTARPYPSEEEISRASKGVREADALRSRVKVRAGGGIVLPLVFAFLAAALLIAGLILSDAARIVCIGGAALAAAFAVAGWILSSSEKKRARRIAAEIEALTAPALALLRAEGRPTDGNLSDELSNLRAEIARRVGDAGIRERTKAELKALDGRIAEGRAKIKERFLVYGICLGDRDNYRDEIESLRRDADAAIREEKAERNRLQKRAEAQAEIDRQEKILQPFLARFNPGGGIDPSRVIDDVSGKTWKYDRILAEIRDISEKLKRLIVEHHLDGFIPPENLPDDGDLAAKGEEIRQKLAAARESVSDLAQKITRLRPSADKAPEWEDAVRRLDAEIPIAEANYNTIVLTEQFLEEAKAALTSRYVGGMQEKFEHFFGMLTKNAPDAVLDTTLAVSLREGGKTRDMEQFSSGWRSAVEFCLRLALAVSLCQDGETPFLLLDDPFVHFDDARLDAAKRMLVSLSKEYQILHVVCCEERS